MIGADLTPVTWHSLWTIEGLVALGTLALAGVTAFLAWRTSTMASKTATLAESTQGLAESTERVAKLTEQDVGLSRIAIEADVRPVLISVPPGQFVHPDGLNYEVTVPETGTVRGHPDRAYVWVQDIDGSLFVSVPFRNEGPGIAFAQRVSFRFQADEWEGVVTARQVPSHEFTRASFLLEAGAGPTFQDLVADGTTKSVAVTYADLAGNVWGTRLVLAARAFNDWYVEGFDLWHEGRTPSVTV